MSLRMAGLKIFVLHKDVSRPSLSACPTKFSAREGRGGMPSPLNHHHSHPLIGPCVLVIAIVFFIPIVTSIAIVINIAIVIIVITIVITIFIIVVIIVVILILLIQLSRS